MIFTKALTFPDAHGYYLFTLRCILRQLQRTKQNDNNENDASTSSTLEGSVTLEKVNLTLVRMNPSHFLKPRKRLSSNGKKSPAHKHKPELHAHLRPPKVARLAPAHYKRAS
ncbi:unnamed protein product [Colias eurytheme]|nr:unnamed protein product [Colias eurytheme]